MSKSEKPDLFDWLGLRFRPDYKKARSLGPLITVAVLTLIIILVGSTALEFLRAVLSIDTFKDQEAQSAAIRNTGLVLAAMIGVPFVVWRSVVAQKQVDVAEQGQITDRINKAVEGLGAQKTVKRQRRRDSGKLAYERDEKGNSDFSKPIYEETSQPNIEVRVGAIYALERIAQDSDRDHIRIMEILCAYVRENAPLEVAELDPMQIWSDEIEQAHLNANTDPNSLGFGPVSPEPTLTMMKRWAKALKGPRTDVQVVLEVIGRRSKSQIALERSAEVPGSKVGYQLDLRNTCLQAADLEELDFRNTLFNKAHMQGVNLKKARIRGAQFKVARMQASILRQSESQRAVFSEAQMEGAFFFKAKMHGAIFWKTQLQNTGFQKAQLLGANLNHTRIQGANFSEAQLRGAQLKSALMYRAILIGAQMEEADFSDAKMQGADLRHAQMQGAYFSRTKMDEKTNFKAVSFVGAAMNEVDLRTVEIAKEQIKEMYGNGSVELPSGCSKPDHWPKQQIDEGHFKLRWFGRKQKTGTDPSEDTS